MGRSVPTYRMTLEGVIAGWNEFRRALRTEDREAFDAVVNRARLHASAASYQASTDPVETVFLAILLEQEKEIRRLKECKAGSSTSTPTTNGT
jgi:hypothetical protein